MQVESIISEEAKNILESASCERTIPVQDKCVHYLNLFELCGLNEFAQIETNFEAIKKYQSKIIEYNINTNMVGIIASALKDNFNSVLKASEQYSETIIAQYSKNPQDSFKLHLGNAQFGLLHIINRHITHSHVYRNDRISLFKNFNRSVIRKLSRDEVYEKLIILVCVIMEQIKHSPLKMEVTDFNKRCITKKFKFHDFGIGELKIVLDCLKKDNYGMVVGGSVLTCFDIRTSGKR